MKKAVALLCTALCCFTILSGCGGATQAVQVLGHEKEVTPLKGMVKPKESGKKAGYQLELPEKGEEIGLLTLSTGDTIKMRFFPTEAPKAVYSFKIHALQGYYDGVRIHRVIPGFMAQTGDPLGNGAGGESVWGEPFEDEFHGNLLNIDGAVAMANSGKNTNGSQFFINNTGKTPPDWDTLNQGFEMYRKAPEEFTNQNGSWVMMDKVNEDVKNLYDENGGNILLDGKLTTNKRGHTVFAQVFEGLEAIDTIYALETDENDRPVTDITISKIEIVPYS